MEYNFNFPNGISNQKVDLYMTGTQGFAGDITVDVTDTFEYQPASGMVSKRFALSFNPSNNIYVDESHYIEDSGATANNWAISDFSWDATNSRYKITLVHLVSTGNLPSVRITAFGQNSASIAQFLTFTAGSIYTTDPTVYGRPYISFNNNVGIGTTTPGAALEVNGNIKMTYSPTNPTSLTFSDGSVQATAYTGVICGGDYTESVDVTGSRTNYEPGDILVIDPGAPGKFLKGNQAYSTLVAGIYSTKPGTVGRRQTTDAKTSTTEVPMAMVGIVPTKVTAENGSIKTGDLLVASSTLGRAMKGTDRSLLTGAVIGKALGTLDSGTGVIEVLVTLQ
jgi:hypothetical protein